MAKLILLRHGQSLWNALNKFTSWVDVPLSERGRAEATVVSCQLRDAGYCIDVCFTSMLIRAIETAIVCLSECNEVRCGKIPVLQHDEDDLNWHHWSQSDAVPFQELPIFPAVALDERYYGELQGKNKAEMAQKYGAEQLHIWRRSFSEGPPGGESLEEASQRTIPYLSNCILPYVRQGKNALVVAHSNSLRAIIMKLEQLTPAEIPKVELKTGVPIVYDINAEGQVINKLVLKPSHDELLDVV